MGQVNAVRFGFEHVQDGGSFTLTAGSLAQAPMPGSAAVSLVNAGIEGFARAAALEAPRRIRVNAVSAARGNRNAASAEDGSIRRSAGRRRGPSLCAKCNRY